MCAGLPMAPLALPLPLRILATALARMWRMQHVFLVGPPTVVLWVVDFTKSTLCLAKPLAGCEVTHVEHIGAC